MVLVSIRGTGGGCDSDPARWVELVIRLLLAPLARRLSCRFCNSSCIFHICEINISGYLGSWKRHVLLAQKFCQESDLQLFANNILPPIIAVAISGVLFIAVLA